jgi:hypothetical protein
VHGIENIRAYFAKAFAGTSETSSTGFDQKLASTSVMTNALIDLDADRAHCESMCLANPRRPAGGSDVHRRSGTRNIDDLVRDSRRLEGPQPDPSRCVEVRGVRHCARPASLSSGLAARLQTGSHAG